MAIVIDYTPGAEVQRLAEQAGVNRVAQQQAEFQQKQDLMQLEQQFQQANMQFTQQAQQQARAEEAMYQMKFIQGKRELDIQMELMTYQREREKLNMALDMIRDADFITEEEREDYTLQAVTRYGTQGNLPAFTNKMDPLVRKGLESDMKSGVFNNAMAQYQKGEITAETASAICKQANLNIGPEYFKTSWEDVQRLIDDQTERLADSTKRFAASFQIDGGDVLDKDTKAKVKPGTEQYANYLRLKRNVDRDGALLDTLITGESVKSQAMADFRSEVDKYESLKQMVDEFGEAAVFEKWRTGSAMPEMTEKIRTDNMLDQLFSVPAGTHPM